MLLAKRIQAIRQHKGHSQKRLYELLDIEQSTYSCYEKEAANLTFKTICKIATALNCSVVFLVDINSGIYDEEKWKQQKCNEWRSVQL